MAAKKKPSGKRIAPDWATIEDEYRTNQVSVSELARRHGISHTAINKRAKAESWARDLSKQVREATAAKLVATPVSASKARETRRETIDRASDDNVAIIRSHRKDIAKGRGLVALLFEQLREAAENRDDVEDEIHDATAGDKDGRRRALMLRAVSLPTHAGALRDLSTALKNLIPLERQAFNLDDPEATVKVEMKPSRDLSRLSVEDLEAMDALIAKMGDDTAAT